MEWSGMDQETVKPIERDLQQRPRLRQACLKLEEIARRLNPGDKLPPMVALRAELGMSFSTLTAAVRELECRGILHSASGVGVYVTDAVEAPVTRKIGVLFRISQSVQSSSVDSYVAEILTGVRREAARHNLEIALIDAETESIEAGSVDALLLYCHLTEALVMDIPPSLPHVLLFQHSPDFACVVPDDFEGTKIATQHLLQNGHRRIAYLSVSSHDSIARQRLAGFHAAHREMDLEVDATRIRFLPHKSPTCSYLQQGETEMKSWLAEGWRDLKCTAILAHNDHTAIGVMKALRAKNLRVPEDISVMGFDGTEISDVCTPSLTTIRVPLEEIGERAVKVLLEQMKDGKIHTEKNVLPVSLKAGDSTRSINER